MQIFNRFFGTIVNLCLLVISRHLHQYGTSVVLFNLTELLYSLVEVLLLAPPHWVQFGELLSPSTTPYASLACISVHPTGSHIRSYFFRFRIGDFLSSCFGWSLGVVQISLCLLQGGLCVR